MGHGNFKITRFEVGYDLRDLVLTPDQIRLRLIEDIKFKIFGGCTAWLTWPSLRNLLWSTKYTEKCK